MLRFSYVLLISLPWVMYYMTQAVHYYNHPERYGEEECYLLAKKVVNCLKRNGRIQTDAYGMENLPQQGGYIMYSNHQGKYDAAGIIASHKNPCTVLIDKKRSEMMMTNQFINLIRGSRLDKSDMKQQMKTILKIAEEVKAGRRYIIFPEGGYRKNHNCLQEFLPGAFKCAQKSGCPIVPVAIIDSYKPFGVNSLRKVVTQVYYLEPIYQKEYQGMNTAQMARLVKSRIEKCMAKSMEDHGVYVECRDAS